ncbi:MAG: alpha/beta hydrolase [Acidobacteria bacterium]|nr:alpha/beta hydrolase [Acidobacteriota bacterium]MCI0723039.1 alpha/beta hydrolase [Acidobacteriota bacterium]
MSRANLIFLAACGLVLLLLHQVIAWQNRDLAVEVRAEPGNGEVALLNIRPAGRSPQSLPVKVLLIHGLSASKSAMRQMAAELARWGADCFLIDLPGHGASPARFSLRASATATDRAVRQLLFRGSEGGATSPQPVVVLGHSFGARAALGAAKNEPRIAAVIALSPATESFTPEDPVPLLILLGEFDFPFVRRGAAFLYEQATGVRLPKLEEPGQWQSPRGPCRLVVLPWTDHTQTLFKAGSLREIKMWLGAVSPEIGEAPFSPWASWARIQLRAIFCVLLFLSWIPLVALLARAIMAAPSGGGRRESVRPYSDATEDETRSPLARGDYRKTLGVPAGLSVTRFMPSRAKLAFRGSRPSLSSQPAARFPLLRVYAFAACVAAVFLLLTNPWKRLELMGGDYLTGFLCVAGVAGLAMLRPAWKDAGAYWRALLCSLLAWLILAAGCAPRVTAEFVHLDLNAARFWRLPWIALSVLPFFLFDEYVCRASLPGLGGARLMLFHLSTRLILAIVVLLGFFVLRNGQFLVVLILPGLLLTGLLCWGLTAWIHRKTGSVAASALFASLATAWFFSVFFAQL